MTAAAPEPIRVALRLPAVYCPQCGNQLVNHLFALIDPTGLPGIVVDLWCAKKEPAGTVAALQEDSVGFVAGSVALDQDTAVRLLLDLGAVPVGPAGAR